MGTRFATWRAVIAVGDGLPSRDCTEAGAHALARYAALCQEAGLIPAAGCATGGAGDGGRVVAERADRDGVQGPVGVPVSAGGRGANPGREAGWSVRDPPGWLASRRLLRCRRPRRGGGDRADDRVAEGYR